MLGSMKPRSNPDFFNGVPELLILQLIAEGEKYGYELVRLIRLRSKEQFSLGEGSIYPILHSLAETGELSTREAVTEGRRRQYYRITAKGRRKLASMLAQWQSVTQAVTSTLAPSHV